MHPPARCEHELELEPERELRLVEVEGPGAVGVDPAPVDVQSGAQRSSTVWPGAYSSVTKRIVNIELSGGFAGTDEFASVLGASCS